MTVRYSHRSLDFLQDVVDKLVPPSAGAQLEKRTDTGAPASTAPESKIVH